MVVYIYILYVSALYENNNSLPLDFVEKMCQIVIK